MSKIVFKIFLPFEFYNCCIFNISSNVLKGFRPSQHDIKSGFIHMSTSSQVEKTCKITFKAIDKLVVVRYNVELLDPLKLKYEMSKWDELYPHYYSDTLPPVNGGDLFTIDTNTFDFSRFREE